MAIEVYLGNPPENIKQWIIEHSQPAGHADTWVKYDGDTEWTPISISGSIEGTFPEDGPPQPTTQIPNITNAIALEIGTEVTSIGDCAFCFCSRLTSVTIPDSVTSIGDSAFGFCGGLTNVTIGNCVMNIGDQAFGECAILTSVTFLGKTMAQIQEMDNYPWGIEDTSIINVA